VIWYSRFNARFAHHPFGIILFDTAHLEYGRHDLSDTGTLPPPQLFNYQVLSFVYKMVYLPHLLPPIFWDYFTFSTSVHTYNVRHKKLYLSQANTQFGQKSLKPTLNSGIGCHKILLTCHLESSGRAWKYFWTVNLCRMISITTLGYNGKN